MLQNEVLRPWIRLSFETLRLGLQFQSSVMRLFNNGQVLMTPVAHAPEAPTPVASALAGTPYSPEVLQAVTDEIASEPVAATPRAAQRAKVAEPTNPKPAATKRSARKAPARRKS